MPWTGVNDVDRPRSDSPSSRPSAGSSPPVSAADDPRRPNGPSVDTTVLDNTSLVAFLGG
jgi:hypothetical protein